MMLKSAHSCSAYCTGASFHLHQNSDHQRVEQAPLKPERASNISHLFGFQIHPFASKQLMG
jgi:hypothetical protein